MKRIQELLEATSRFLQSKGFQRPRREAEDVLSAGLQKSRLDLYCHFDEPLTAGEVERCRDVLKRRLAREPIQYIEGSVTFCQTEIAVTRSVLIPRPETEQLAAQIIEEIEEGPFLDLCCGSGCIGIAVKRARPDIEVVLSDISPEALEVARGNAERNGVEVEIVQGDLCKPHEGRGYRAVVCNPPYIREADYLELEPEVRDWEPRSALVAEEEGQQFYRRLSEELPAITAANSKIWLEIGEAGSLQFFPTGKILNDWSGRPRFIQL